MVEIRSLDLSHLEDILEIQDKVIEALPKKEVLQPSTREFEIYCLTGGGICLGAFCEETGKLIAYRIAYFPMDREFNLARGYVPDTEVEKVAHLDTTAVLPEWRRRGLADQLNFEMMECLKVSGMKHLFCTVSPYNPGSMFAIIKTGSRPIKLINIFGGKLRFLCYRPLPNEWPVADAEEKRVFWDDLDSLKSYLSKGFIGIQMDREQERPILTLQANQFPFEKSKMSKL